MEGGRLKGNLELLGSVQYILCWFSARLECSPGIQLPEQIRSVSGGEGEGGDKEAHKGSKHWVSAGSRWEREGH